ncbi:MAG: hypothetical protein ACOYOH_25470 [Paracraurococcus sp.]
MDEMEQDFRSALRVAGVTVPEARYAIMLDAYRSWRSLATVLDAPTPYALEPAAAPHLAPSPWRETGR